MIRVEDFAAQGSPSPTLRRPSKRTKRLQPFLRGPIPLEWLRKTLPLPKPAIYVGLTLWHFRGFLGSPSSLRIDSNFRKRLGISADQARRGVRALQSAGLVEVQRQGRGRCLVVQLVTDEADEKPP
jgi:hypothetical protein